MSAAKEWASLVLPRWVCNQLQSGGLCISVEKRNDGWLRTSPSNLYAAVMWTWNFCWRNPLEVQIGIEGSQIGAKSAGTLVVDAVQPQGAGRFDVF